jgi:hypothetical protein
MRSHTSFLKIALCASIISCAGIAAAGDNRPGTPVVSPPIPGCPDEAQLMRGAAEADQLARNFDQEALQQIAIADRTTDLGVKRMYIRVAEEFFQLATRALAQREIRYELIERCRQLRTPLAAAPSLDSIRRDTLLGTR